MYLLFGLPNLLKYAALVVGALWIVFVLIQPPESIWMAARYVGIVGMVLGILTTLFGARWGLWRILWRLFPKLNQMIYPDLNGVWKGEVSSNWSVIAERSDPEQEGMGNTQDSYPVSIRVTASWLSIHLYLESQSSYSTSETIWVVPKRAIGAANHKLYYVYHNQATAPLSTDSSFHLGAARLEIEWSDTPVLRGEYWTNRNWKKGLNTAGTIDLKRVSKDPNRANRLFKDE